MLLSYANPALELMSTELPCKLAIDRKLAV